MDGRENVPRTTAVPRDRILDVPDSPAADRERAAALFRECHEISEALYNGDGSWGRGCADEGVFPHVDTPCTRPMVRQTAWRASGYLAAHSAVGDPMFEERAQAGCEHLVREQRPDGYFPYYLDDSGWPVHDPAGLMYVTGIAVDALLDGYEAFGDPRFLGAAYRGCEWAMRIPHVPNTNYNSFCVFALARTAAIVDAAPGAHRPSPSFVWAKSHGGKRPGDNAVEDFVARAAYFTQSGVFPNQQDNGGWPGHNSWIWYHGIILLGHARMLRAVSLLPSDHALHGLLGRRLRESAIAAVNYLVLNLTPEGELYRNHESTEAGSPGWPVLALCALRPEDVGNDEGVSRLCRLLSVALVHDVAREKVGMINPEIGRTVETLAGNVMALGRVLRYLDEER